jgi:mannose-6-phosphate isomerase-like protein (cupin superfamily)
VLPIGLKQLAYDLLRFAAKENHALHVPVAIAHDRVEPADYTRISIAQGQALPTEKPLVRCIGQRPGGLGEIVKLVLFSDPVPPHPWGMEKTIKPELKLVPAEAQDWRRLPLPGVSLALLRDHAGERTLLLRMEPGARHPRHLHPAGEQLYVLEGDVDIDGQRLTAGDFLYTPPGASHAVASVNGCLMFIVVPQPIEILGERAA